MKKAFFYSLSVVIALVLVFSSVTPASAASPIYVRTDGDDTNCNGTTNAKYTSDSSPNCAFKTIKKGITEVSAGGTVYVNDGTYIENIVIQNKNLKLLSLNGRSSTIIQGVSGLGSLATILVEGTTTGVQIGDIDHGFTIIGIDNGNPGVENAALYFRGSHSGAIIKGNEITANGDHGLLSEYGATIANFVIDSNVFSGKTFIGDTPGGDGFNEQFSTPNVPRQLVVMGGGATGTLTTNIQFTNNQVIGIAGGIKSDGKEQGNTLVTIDASGSLIKGNTFAGKTTRYATSLRARRPNTTIENNNFISTGLTPTCSHIYLENNYINEQLIQANTFDKGVYFETNKGVVGISLKPFGMSAPNGSVLRVLPGTYNEPTGVEIRRRVTFLGSGSDTTIIKGSFEVYTNTVAIQGFKIENGTASGTELHGIYIAAGLSGVQVKNNWLVGTWTGGASNFVGGRGILTGYNVSNLTVENNVIEKWVSGLYLNPTNGAITVQNNEIKNNWAGAGTDGQGNALFKNNYFIGNIEGIGASSVGASFKIEENAFIGNTDAVKWYSGNSLSASRNWWNGNKGPTVSSNPKGNGQPISSSVEYRPWLCDGTDTQPNVLGFQPAADAAKCTNLATKLVFTQYPSSAFENIPFAQQPAVRAEDDDGNLAITFDNYIFIDIANNPTGGLLLPGPRYIKASDGVATFSSQYINKAGQGYTLKAFGLGSSGDFILTEGAAFDVLKQQADLSVTVMASPDPVNAGETLSYTVTVTNGGPHNAQGVSVSFQLPAGFTYQSAGGSGWSCSQSGGVVTCTRAALPSGQSAQFTVQGTAPTQAGSITATATVTLSEVMDDPNSANNQASATTTVVELPPTGPSFILYLPLVLNSAAP